MDRKLHRAARELGVKGEYLFEAERRKRLLANSIFIKIRNEVALHPETDEFILPMSSALGKLERFVLSHYPHDVSNRMPSRHPITLRLDESVEPPLLAVSIGQSNKHD